MQLKSIGSDPEMFLTFGGYPIPATGLIGGTKREPRPIGDGVFIQEDNVLVEVNTVPAKSIDAFVEGVRHALELAERAIPDGYGLEYNSVAAFDPELLLTPQAAEFGCEHDYNAWTGGGINACFTVEQLGNMRVAGGHIHIGYNKPTKSLSKSLIRYMDLYAAVPAVIMDKEDYRRQFYGTAGRYRYKPYGVEYRTLSNFWLKKTKYIRWVYETVERSVAAVSQGIIISAYDGAKIIKAVNESNTKIAEELISEHELVLV